MNIDKKQKELIEFFERTPIWREHPHLFLEEVLGVKIPIHQKKLIDAIKDFDKISIRSANSIGKSFLVSALILWFFFCYLDPDPNKNVIVIFTAPSFDKVKDNIYSQICQFIELANEHISKKFGQNAKFVGKLTNNQNIS